MEELAEPITRGAITTEALLTVLGVPNLSYEHFFGPVGLRAGVGIGSLAYFVPYRQAEVGLSFSMDGSGGLYVFGLSVLSRVEYEGEEATGTAITGGLGYHKRFGRFYLDGYAGLAVRGGDEVDIREERGNATLTVSVNDGVSLARGLRLGIAF